MQIEMKNHIVVGNKENKQLINAIATSTVVLQSIKDPVSNNTQV
jgi:hypothetical protein